MEQGVFDEVACDKLLTTTPFGIDTVTSHWRSGNHGIVVARMELHNAEDASECAQGYDKRWWDVTFVNDTTIIIRPNKNPLVVHDLTGVPIAPRRTYGTLAVRQNKRIVDKFLYFQHKDYFAVIVYLHECVEPPAPSSPQVFELVDPTKHALPTVYADQRFIVTSDRPVVLEITQPVRLTFNFVQRINIDDKIFKMMKQMDALRLPFYCNMARISHVQIDTETWSKVFEWEIEMGSQLWTNKTWWSRKEHWFWPRQHRYSLFVFVLCMMARTCRGITPTLPIELWWSILQHVWI